MKQATLIVVLILLGLGIQAQQYSDKIITGAEQFSQYITALKNKKVAMLVNQTSVVDGVHLVDTLRSSGIKVVKIFSPEHGFRGTADAGEHVKSGVDLKTGIPITSMYGANKKPNKESMAGIDIVVFDIQDVGARFYTYISSLQYMMEACAEAGIPLLILDRPNPNGFYVDGPVLEPKLKSFVGMQPIPIVHGMTVAEYAQMLKGEKWLNTKKPCQLKVVGCKNYDHKTLYHVPIPPSPNLKSDEAILWYPSLCLFEGSDVSVGRGTETPFEVWGHPDFTQDGFSFTPVSMPGAKNPPHENKRCYGENLHKPVKEILLMNQGRLNLSFLVKAYSLSSKSTPFFNSFFEKLAGTTELKEQIINGKSISDIQSSWKPKLDKFKKIRRKYLLYPDFE